jgi:hypothetical protein
MDILEKQFGRNTALLFSVHKAVKNNFPEDRCTIFDSTQHIRSEQLTIVPTILKIYI